MRKTPNPGVSIFLFTLLQIFVFQSLSAKTGLSAIKKLNNHQKYSPAAFQSKAAKNMACDTPRLLGWDCSPNVQVIIDGKTYTADILTKISPSCVSGYLGGGDRITITTKHKKIEKPTAMEIANAGIMISAEESGGNCFRYMQTNEDGSKYDMVVVRLNGWGAGLKVATGSKVLIIIDGKNYSEEEVAALSQNIPNPKPDFKITQTPEGMTKLYPQYAKQYGGVIEFTSADK